MSALSIRSMNWTLGAMEMAMDEQSKSLPPVDDIIHYWSVYRKASGRKKQKFIARFFCTKTKMAETWNKFYGGGGFRLIHEQAYNTKKNDANPAKDQPANIDPIMGLASQSNSIAPPVD